MSVKVLLNPVAITFLKLCVIEHKNKMVSFLRSLCCVECSVEIHMLGVLKISAYLLIVYVYVVFG